VLPPDAATVVLYAEPTVAPGNDVVEMVRELVVVPEMTRPKFPVAVCLGEEESVMVSPME